MLIESKTLVDSTCIKKQLEVNISTKELKKIIASVGPGDVKKLLGKKKNGENIFLQIIKSKIKN